MGTEAQNDIIQQIDSSETNDNIKEQAKAENIKAEEILAKIKDIYGDESHEYTQAIEEYRDVKNKTLEALACIKSDTLKEMSCVKEITQQELMEIKKEVQDLKHIDEKNENFTAQEIYKKLQEGKKSIDNIYIQTYIDELTDINGDGYNYDVTDMHYFLLTMIEKKNSKKPLPGVNLLHNEGQEVYLEKIVGEKGHNDEYIQGYNNKECNYLLNIKDTEATIRSADSLQDIDQKLLLNYISYLTDTKQVNLQQLLNVFGSEKFDEIKIMIAKVEDTPLKNKLKILRLEEDFQNIEYSEKLKNIIVDDIDTTKIENSFFKENPEQIISITNKRQLLQILNENLADGSPIKTKNISRSLLNDREILSKCDFSTEDMFHLNSDFIQENCLWLLEEYKHITPFKDRLINHIYQTGITISDDSFLNIAHSRIQEKEHNLYYGTVMKIKTEKQEQYDVSDFFINGVKKQGGTCEAIDLSIEDIIDTLKPGIHSIENKVLNSQLSEYIAGGALHGKPELLQKLIDKKYVSIIIGALDINTETIEQHLPIINPILDKYPNIYNFFSPGVRANKELIKIIIHGNKGENSISDFLQSMPTQNINDLLFIFKEYAIKQKTKGEEINLQDIYTPQIQAKIKETLENTDNINIDRQYSDLFPLLIEKFSDVSELKEAKKNISAQVESTNWDKKYPIILEQLKEKGITITPEQEKKLSFTLRQYLFQNIHDNVIFKRLEAVFPKQSLNLFLALKDVKLEDQRIQNEKNGEEINFKSVPENLKKYYDKNKKLDGEKIRSFIRNNIDPKKIDHDGYKEDILGLLLGNNNLISEEIRIHITASFNTEFEQIKNDIHKKIAEDEEARISLIQKLRGEKYDKKAYEEMMQESFEELQGEEKKREEAEKIEQKEELKPEPKPILNTSKLLLAEQGIDFHAEKNIITKGDTIVPLSDTDQKLIIAQPEMAEKVIETYKIFQEVGITKLWKYSENIFQAVANKQGANFNIKDGDYIGKNEIFIVLNSLLVASGEEVIKSKNLTEFTTAFERKNNVQFSGNAAEKGVMGYTKIEDIIIKKYADIDGNMGFKQSRFEDAIS